MIKFVAAQDIWINEIFPNPPSDDNNKEFVEIYSPGFVNLSDFIIGDNASNDTLVAVQYWESNYSLIVEEGFNYGDINASVYSVGATIGNNLGNTGDTVFFYMPNGTLLDTVFYETNQEGYSYEKNESGWFPSVVENGTPGLENSIINIVSFVEDLNKSTTEQIPEETYEDAKELQNSISLTVLFPSEIYMNQTITTGFRIENNRNEKITAILTYIIYLQNVTIFNDTKIFENISQYRTKDTVAITVQEAGDYTLCGTATSNVTEEDFSDNTACSSFFVLDPAEMQCDRAITLAINKTFYKNKEEILFQPAIGGDSADLPFVFSYWIEEFSGAIVKQPRESSNTNTKQWTPHLQEAYAVYEIHAEFLETTCVDTNVENNHAVAYVIVEGSPKKEDSGTINKLDSEKQEEAKVQEQKTYAQDDKEYNALVFPKIGYNNETVASSLLIYNTDSERHSYKVSSKIYRGPKTYSGIDFENRQYITLLPEEKKHIILVNSLMNISPGTYKIKIQIQKDNYKTLKELRDELLVVAPHDSSTHSSENVSSIKEKEQEDMFSAVHGKNASTITFAVPTSTVASSERGMQLLGEVVPVKKAYEGAFYKIKPFLPYLLSIFVLLFGILLLFHKA